MSTDAAARPPLEPGRLADLPLRVEIVASSPSTNADVATRARDGEPEGLVIVTEHQTAGRGRLDRVWTTPDRAALTFSVLLRPTAPAHQWPWFPLLVGYAVQAALADRVPAVGLKWPNDVLVEDPVDAQAPGRKLAGILVERVETPQGPAAVVGVGLNVLQTAEELPLATATSLALELPSPPDRTEVLREVLGSLHALLPLIEDTASLRRAYADACTTLGREVTVELPGGAELRGTAVDLGASGALVVSVEGREVEVGAGDVVHVRPDQVG